jgi:hypothetical protein
MGKTGAFFKGMLNGVATMLNASGSAVVSMYDTGAIVVNKTRTVVVPTEKARLERGIKEQTTKIIALQYEIGKESARYADPAEALEALEMRANIARVKDCEREIETMKQRLAEIAQQKETAKAEKKAKKARKKASPVAETLKAADEKQEAAPSTDEIVPVVEGVPEHEQQGDTEILKAGIAGQEDSGSHASVTA